eukprot:5979852-Amphidinium_carterae.1
MSVVLAASRKRSGAFALLRQLRVLSFMELVSGTRAFIRWLPSESNVADKSSRLPPNSLLHVEQATPGTQLLTPPEGAVAEVSLENAPQSNQCDAVA